jgi:predicted protein tyrosine phosphatase
MSEQKLFVVRSRKHAAEFVSSTPWAAISVSTEPNQFPDLSEENRKGLLQLSFWDINNPKLAEDERVRDRMFTSNQARQVLDFAAKMWVEVNCFLIHCEAGICRSPAIAAAITHIYYGSGEEKEYFNRYMPNYWVYKTILEEHYGHSIGDMYVQSDKRREIQEKFDRIFGLPVEK